MQGDVLVDFKCQDTDCVLKGALRSHITWRMNCREDAERAGGSA
jgi:hypothetical protein